MKIRFAVRMVLTAIVAVAVASCSAAEPSLQPSDPSRSQGPQTTASASTPTGGTAPASPTPSCPAAVPSSIKVSGTGLPEETSFGFVHHADGEALYVDPAEVFGNEAALQAAIEDGELAPGDTLDNPFYVRNPDTAIVRVPVSDKLTVTVLDNQQTAPHPLSAAQFAAAFCEEADRSWMYGGFSNEAPVPMEIRVSNGQVVQADEQYLP